MNDRPLSIHHVIAGALWVLALGLVVAGLATKIVGIGQLGLLFGAAAAVAQVRGYICQATTRVLVREQNAFELGRDYGPDVRSLR